MRTSRTPTAPRTIATSFALPAVIVALVTASASPTRGNPPQATEMPNMHARFMAQASTSAIELGFAVGIGYAAARIRAGNMTFFYDPEHPDNTTATAYIDANTIATGQDELDQVLKSADWLDTDNHSHILFHSSGVGADADGRYLAGDLTIKETTRPVKLRIDGISDVLREPQTKLDMVHFKGHAVISRSAFGLGTAPMWNEPAIGDLPRVGDEVRIELHITGFSFNDEYLAQMFRRPLEDGSPHPVGLVYDAVLAGGAAAGIEEYERLKGAHADRVNNLTLSDAAWFLMLTGHADEAIAIFDKSIDEKADTMTYLRQADAYVFAGRRDEAIENYTSMWQYYPTLPHIPEMLRLLGVQNPTSGPGR